METPILKEIITIIIDGRSVAYDKNAKQKFNVEKIIQCLEYFYENYALIEMQIVMPAWIDNNVQEQLSNLVEIHTVTGINKENDRDDKYIIGAAIRLDAFFVSNDKKMYKHIKNELIDRSWCANRRIGFYYKNSVFNPEYSMFWRRSSVAHRITGDSNKEVRT